MSPSPAPVLNHRAHLGALALLALMTSVGSVAACSGSEEPPGSGGGSAGASLGGSAGAGGLGTSGTGLLPGGASGAATGGSAGSSTGGSAIGGSGGTAGTSGSAGSAGSGGTGGSLPEVPATFETVKRVVGMSCFGAPCHDEPGNPLQMKPIENLVTKLKGHTTQDCGPALTPGNPANSAFVKLLKADCGMTARMPLGKCFEDTDPGCVPPEDIAAIEKWVQNGAMP